MPSSTTAQSIFKTHLRRKAINKTAIPTPPLTRPDNYYTIQTLFPNTSIIIFNIHKISGQVRNRSFISPMSSLSDRHHSTHTPTTNTVRVVVKGRVQGVFYRNWTIENAKELGLKGWVRNRRDGSVEALFSGNSDKVYEMEQRCRRGPPAAMVTALEVSPCTDDPGSGFERKQTV